MKAKVKWVAEMEVENVGVEADRMGDYVKVEVEEVDIPLRNSNHLLCF